ncbi:hypothetical protein VMCG_08114 [Cytospora schulzeri]|uniref:AB hydrolase-1 domain-containing protein n=1 Tax=Cytospora schulzeri TaxID=448051 RepID=A0A423VRK0_9PEZI|nr:hypothetical protein VMCG_08114 [Valsa malicola]
MDCLTKKTITTNRGFTYTYYVSPAAAGKPTLLLQHGFPDTADTWEDLITQHLQPAGYGAIAPDLLGYGGTSKPTDPAAYKFGGMTADMVAILDAEGVDKVIPLGYDWGSRAAAMLYNLHPGRVTGLITVGVPYMGAPRGPMDLDAAIAHTGIWYWKLFTADDGARLMNENADLMYDILHAPEAWSSVICPKDALRKALETRGEGFAIKRRPYATEEMRNTFVERIRRDGFDAPLCWYKSHVLGHQSDESDPDNQVVNVPTLFLGYPEDVLCPEEVILSSVRTGFLPQLTSITLNGAHWGLVEHPKEFGEAVTQWLDRTHGS